MKKLTTLTKQIMAGLTTFLVLGSARVYADAASQLQNGAGAASGQSGGDAVGSVNSTLSTVFNWISVIVGVIAVVMIILGGLKYITSAGDSTKVGEAKKTIMYALIGVAIAALAQIIVRFVLHKAATA